MIFHFLPQMFSSHSRSELQMKRKWLSLTYSNILQHTVSTLDFSFLPWALAPSPDWHCHYTFILNASAAPANSPFANVLHMLWLLAWKSHSFFGRHPVWVAAMRKSRALEQSNEKSEKCTLFSLKEGERRKIILHHTRHYTLNSIASAAPKMLSQMSQMLAYNHSPSYRKLSYYFLLASSLPRSAAAVRRCCCCVFC